MGDPAGIGPEVTLKAWRARDKERLPAFFVVADANLLSRRAQALGLEIAIETATPGTAAAIFAHALPVLPLLQETQAVAGQPTPLNAPAIVESIERAVACAAEGSARGVVTNPISKSVLYAAGFAHPGHTEFLGELAQRHSGAPCRAVMMLWARELAVVPLTIHIPLAEAPKKLTRALIVETAAIVARDVTNRFGVARPRLAFSGLNPHAGENGALGREEIDVMAPALADLRAQGIDARGPFPADTLFHAAARGGYDVALCPTHDQALIPIKTLAFERGVNVTLGLPFIRTSPDHGTAFDIADKGVADPTSLIEAIRLADRMTL